MRKYLLAILVIVLLSAGVVVGLILVKNKQIFNQKAFNQGGTATISISPATASFDRGTPYTVSVYFNTHGISINAVSFRIDYANPGIKASGITINPDLLSQSWTCPTKSIATDSSGVTDNIDLSCAFIQAGSGYSNNADTLLATFTVTASQVPANNPVAFSFDPDPILTVITQSSDSTDIALTPTSTGSFTINDVIAQSPTPTPIIVVGSPTPTPITTQAPTSSPTATPAPTSTSTAAAQATSTPVPTSTSIANATTTPKPSGTANPSLPVTGFDAPTVIGGISGVLLLIFGAAALIL